MSIMQISQVILVDLYPAKSASVAANVKSSRFRMMLAFFDGFHFFPEQCVPLRY